MTARIGVLVMAYGTPKHPDELEAYYTDIRRGRPPEPQQLADLRRRYDAIGGLSPLAALTDSQATALQAALDTAMPSQYRVFLGLKHASPTVEAGAQSAVDAGSKQVIGLVLAPHFSAFSIGQYHERARKIVEAAGLHYAEVDSWHVLPEYIAFLTAGVRERLAGMPAGTRVVFTAHSLPQRIVATGDRYPAELAETAADVAHSAELAQFDVAYQSAGRTPEPWLGPDILEYIRQAAEQGAPGVLVCPCGFVADHLEVLYDLDIEAQKLAGSLGIAFARTPMLNSDPTVMAALAEVVHSLVD
jgi:ferrochelatase